MNQAMLCKKANQIRDEIINVAARNGAGHIASSLSCVDILVALYYKCMTYDDKDPQWEGRDRLIFSKAHGGYGVYAILADKGVIPRQEWENFHKEINYLSGCMERKKEYGFEAGCGSLGHGLPMAVGLAFGAQLQGKNHRTFCITGDGELQEGSTWEALQFAVKHSVDNLTIIIDQNRLQAMDFIVNILDIDKDSLSRRLRGFGLSPYICPGHDIKKLVRCINKTRKVKTGKPHVIIAQTTKGFSLRCMENVPKFHFRAPNKKELSKGRAHG